MYTSHIESRLRASASVEGDDQYSLAKILGIWASVALPMGLIPWVVMPFLMQRVDMHPGFLYLILINLALVWQGVVAYAVLRRELKPFTWEKIKARLWLNTPTDPRTGIPSKWLYLWAIPCIIFLQAWDEIGVLNGLNELWLKTFPFLAPTPFMVIQNLAEPAVGQWWLLAILPIQVVFNYLLGEELIFRGILLPKMNGVFGKWDFIVNGILFATYHLHKFWEWPSQVIIRDWTYAWAAKRFKSYWMSVLIHGFDAIVVVVLFNLAIMGLAR